MESEILNLLVLPLLGGYVFYTKLHATSFAAKRAEGQRLIYSSGVAGVFLLIAAHGADELLNKVTRTPALHETLQTVGLACTIITAAVAGAALLMFSRKSDLVSFKHGYPRTALVSGIAVVTAAVTLYGFNFNLKFQTILRTFVGVLFWFAVVVLIAKWVIDTSKLHYSTVTARVSLTALAISGGATATLQFGPWLASNWSHFSAIKYSGTALLAMVLGVIAWMPINVVLTQKWAWRRAHERGETSGIEYLLFKAFSDLALFQISLRDGKVYVGFLLDMPAPQPRLDGSCVEFVPIRSGYRKQVTKEVVNTTNYVAVLAKIAQEASPSEQPRSADALRLALDPAVASMAKVVPISEVVVGGMFNEKFSDDDFVMPLPPRLSRPAGTLKPRKPRREV